LIEHSASYSKKLVVNSGALEFIEASDNGQLIDDLALDINPQQLDHFIDLIGAVWWHIQNLDFPNITKYKKDITGVLAFEQDRIDKAGIKKSSR
jgi:hypothetical protein